MRKRNFEYFCDDFENIQNYDKAKADNFVDWDCHHRLETHNSDGERRLVDITQEELIALGMYIHRPASELIFLRHSEHTQLHKKGKPSIMKGQHHTNDARKKISEGHKGKHHSEDAKRKMSKARAGERNPQYGKHWFNNGEINIICLKCPEGFVPGRVIF